MDKDFLVLLRNVFIALALIALIGLGLLRATDLVPGAGWSPWDRFVLSFPMNCHDVLENRIRVGYENNSFFAEHPEYLSFDVVGIEQLDKSRGTNLEQNILCRGVLRAEGYPDYEIKYWASINPEYQDVLSEAIYSEIKED